MLYQHQKNIVDDDQKKTGIFLGTGGGKTRVCLKLAVGKTLVVAPKTQFEDENWPREVDKMGETVDLTVISKEKFRKTWDELPRYDTFIGDECHTLCGVSPSTVWKNRRQEPKTSQLFNAVCKYIEKHNPERVYMATATPNRSPMAVWAVARILGEVWDFYKFRHTYYFPLPMPGRQVFSVKSDDGTKQRLADTVKKLGYVGCLEDWVDVPQQIHKTDYFNLNAKQKKSIKEVTVESENPLITFQKTDQIENGILIGDEYLGTIHFKSAKIDAILDYAEEFPQILIFARYTAQIELIQANLEKAGKKVLILNGKTKDKGVVIKEANESDECIIIAQSQISSGYELPSYPCVIFASMSGSQVDLIQGIGRVQRINNIKKNIYIYLVTRGGADEAKYNTLMDKKDFHDHIYIKNLT